MQLFCMNINEDKTDIWQSLEILDLDIFFQTTKVLRYGVWKRFFVQNFGRPKYRFETEIVKISKDGISTEITKKVILWDFSWPKTKILCAMPNKFDKIETIVQKLTEIWLDQIIFRPSSRSIIREINDKKMQRLAKISKEATEQSWSNHNTEIKFDTKVSSYLENSQIFVLDKKWPDDITFWEPNLVNTGSQNLLAIVGPEWWLSDIDYENRQNLDYKIINLWDNMLRTETACIVAGWGLINLI